MTVMQAGSSAEECQVSGIRILYDHQVFSLQNAGGASRYYFELASHLSRLPHVGVDVCLGFNHSVYPFHSLEQFGARIVGWDAKLSPGLPRYALNELVTGAWRSEERRVGKECRSRWSP